MFETIDSFSGNDSVQIFPSSRKLYPQEVDPLKEKIEGFKIQISKEFDGKVETLLIYERFVIFVFHFEDKAQMNVTYNSLNAFISNIEQELNITLMDRMNVCFKQGQYVQYKDLKAFKKLIKSKSVNAQTIVFDNLVTTVDDLKSYWELPISETWYSRFL
ncbi:ABC transporter ATPase [Flavobacteriaceae bacterium]|nr:ABC transporter ATPase [Flavobacteriaceae bacterium]